MQCVGIDTIDCDVTVTQNVQFKNRAKPYLRAGDVLSFDSGLKFIAPVDGYYLLEMNHKGSIKLTLLSS